MAKLDYTKYSAEELKEAYDAAIDADRNRKRGIANLDELCKAIQKSDRLVEAAMRHNRKDFKRIVKGIVESVNIPEASRKPKEDEADTSVNGIANEEVHESAATPADTNIPKMLHPSEAEAVSDNRSEYYSSGVDDDDFFGTEGY